MHVFTYIIYIHIYTCIHIYIYICPSVQVHEVPQGRQWIGSNPEGTIYLSIDSQIYKQIDRQKERQIDSALEKIKTAASVPENAILFTADVAGLNQNIAHQAGLKGLKESFEKRNIKKIPTNDLAKMAEFVLNNNIFEFNSKVYQQKSAAAIRTKIAPPYACIYMNEVEKFPETKRKTLFIWLKYIDDIFLSGLMVNTNQKDF